MKTVYKYLLLVLLVCSLGITARSQTSYLLNFEHKVKGGTENTYFYLEQLTGSIPPGVPQEKVLVLDGITYRVNYMRLQEKSPSWYVGCSQYGNQARGEELSINRLLSDSVLRTHAERQQAIEAECSSLFDNRGRQNSMLSVDLNRDDKVKLIKIEMEYCSCITGRDQFSHLSDTLVMPRKVVKASVFLDNEKGYWENNLGSVLQNDFVKSCLPGHDHYFRSFQAGRED